MCLQRFLLTRLVPYLRGSRQRIPSDGSRHGGIMVPRDRMYVRAQTHMHGSVLLHVSTSRHKCQLVGISTQPVRTMTLTLSPGVSPAQAQQFEISSVLISDPGVARDDSDAQNDAPAGNPLASECVRRKSYESCSRSRCQQFVADQRRSATSART